MQTGSAATHMLIDESVPVKRGLLSQALQTRGGGLEAKLTKALPTLHSPCLSISLFSFSPSHTTNTHTLTHSHVYTCTYSLLPFPPAVYFSFVNSVTHRASTVADAADVKMFGDFTIYLKVSIHIHVHDASMLHVFK